MGKDIVSLVNTEAIERNRYYFFSLIDVEAFLDTHQLVFREKIEAFESKDEGGNGFFLSLFDCTVKKTAFTCNQ